MTHEPSLSKSRYLSGAQCHLRLWYDSHAPGLAPVPSDALQVVFDTGHEVGEAARKRFPGGHFVSHDHRHTPQALEETRQVMEAGIAPAVFEAAFQHERVLIRADVIQRLPGGGWRLVEVKSTTRLKEVFILDLAVQLWVLRGAGLDVRDAAVLTLDNNYVYDGVQLDLGALFKLHPLFDEAVERLDAVRAGVREMRGMLAKPAAPDIAPGEHCFTPYECQYYTHCTRDHAAPEHGIGELPRLAAPRRAQLEAAHIEEVRNIPDDFPLTQLQSIVRQAVREDRAVVYSEISRTLAEVTPPVRHLDFETFAPAIPRFAGTRPYEQIPFLFSVHTENGATSPTHTAYLHAQEDDPRPLLADRLIAAVGREGTICTYSGYERRVLRDLVAALPDRAEAIGAIERRLFDLHAVVRNGYYHPEFNGSFSIKNVLPVLVPGMGYGDLAIANGQTAAVRYVSALSNPDLEEGTAFVILGDFNRRLAVPGDWAWRLLSPPSARLYLATSGLVTSCDPRFAELIDHLVVGRGAESMLLTGSISELPRHGPHPDHCALSAVLRVEGDRPFLE